MLVAAMRLAGSLLNPFGKSFVLYLIFLAYTIAANGAERSVVPVDGNETAKTQSPTEEPTVNSLPAEEEEKNALESPSPPVADVSYALERGNVKIQEKKRKRRDVDNIRMWFIMVLTSAIMITMIILITWDLMNFVGNVPDPFKDVQEPKNIPFAIQKLIAEGKSLAFVVRRCKYCGLGIRELKKAGKDVVIVMVDGHRHKRVIDQYLNRPGYPHFIIDNKRRGNLTEIKTFLEEEIAARKE